MTKQATFISEDELREMARTAPIMAPGTVGGVSITTGVFDYLSTDEVVTVMEVLVIFPTEDGDESAIFPLVFDPVMAQIANLTDTPKNGEKN